MLFSDVHVFCDQCCANCVNSVMIVLMGSDRLALFLLEYFAWGYGFACLCVCCFDMYGNMQIVTTQTAEIVTVKSPGASDFHLLPGL